MKTYTHTYTITYNDALRLFAELTKGKSVKPFSWEIISRANYRKGTKTFENALDYGIGMSFQKLIMWRRQTRSKLGAIVFSFHSKGCDILTESGTLLIEDN